MAISHSLAIINLQLPNCSIHRHQGASGMLIEGTGPMKARRTKLRS